MWHKPWRLSEGFTISSGLVITGLLLQYTVGAIPWQAFAWPVNVIVLVMLLAIAVVLHLLRGRFYGVRFLTTAAAAVPALTMSVAVTIVMGLTRQHTVSMPGSTWIHNMLSSWPLVLCYAWMALILCLTVLQRLRHRRWRDIPFYLNHLGLLIVLLAGTLGNADMQRLTLTATAERPEWRAIDAGGNVHELPLAVQLEQFTIDEYAPRLMVVGTHGGKYLPQGNPASLTLDSTTTVGELLGWHIDVRAVLDKAAPMMSADSTAYVVWPSSGATTAAHIVATRDTITREGWLTCGSYLFPMQLLTLDDSLTLAMPEREPRAYVSTVHIYTRSEKNIRAHVRVNQPIDVEGWKIYQLDYNRQMGRWSDTSVLELVRDPWLPIVYCGIAMMMIGAVALFLNLNTRKKK